MDKPLLQVKDLHVSFKRDDKRVGKAVNGVSYEVYPGRTLGIIGESGSGKSVSAMTVLGLIGRKDTPGTVTGGEILFEGRDLLKYTEEEMYSVRGNDISMIFQEPMTSLNPVFTVGYQIEEALRLHSGLNRQQIKERAVELLKMVNIPSPETRIRQYPHQLSGGLRQRVMIAMALACDPKILIADEPTTALDVTIEAQILWLLKQLRQEHGTAIILVTHDMGVIAENVDDVVVMYAGQVVEQAPVVPLFEEPLHPYTQGLMKATPDIDMDVEKLNVIPGVVPSIYEEIRGCAFAPRCPYAKDICFRKKPELLAMGERQVRCLKFTEEYQGGAENE